MADKPTILTPDGVEAGLESEKEREAKSLVVSKDLLPDSLLIIPLHDRPMFPKMMGPVIIDDPTLQGAVLKHTNQNAPLYFGLILQIPREDGLAHPMVDVKELEVLIGELRGDQVNDGVECAG